MARQRKTIEAFNFEPGQRISDDYEIISKLGDGWESEVYRIRERVTKVERAAKFFFPHRNVGNKISVKHAQRLHKLRHCPILIQYHHHEKVDFNGETISCLISELVEGELLSKFLKRQPGKRLDYFQALHLLGALAKGIEPIHQAKEYHGDLHLDNVMIQRHGLGFQVKLIDMFHWRTPTAQNVQEDVIQLVRLFYDVMGGANFYAKQPQIVKSICKGLKRGQITAHFRTAGKLNSYLQTLTWE